MSSLENVKEIVVQQVNCIGVMGAGIAKAIRQDITDTDYAKYQNICKSNSPKDLLGKVTLIPSKSRSYRVYANVFAQASIGTDKIRTDYQALETELAKINNLAKDKNYKVIIPEKIGCGLGGGDWNVVHSIITKVCNSEYTTISNNIEIQPISTSTELKIGCLKNKGDNKMKVNLSKLELGTSRKNSMLPVSELNRKDYLDNPEILNKYFRVNNHDIDTCYVSEEISIDEVRADFHNKKLYKDGNMLKAKTAEYYTGNKFYLNLDADDDSFRNGDDDSRKLSGYDVYVAQEVRSSTVDKDLFEELYRFCIKTIKRRLVMLLDTEKIINELINIINYTDGFSNNCTAIQSSALVNSKKNLLKKISNRSVKDFIKSNNDYTVFGTDELTRNDYIGTYQRVLRKLTDIRDSNLDFIRDIISNKEDCLENEILENNLELETISLSNSENSLELDY